LLYGNKSGTQADCHAYLNGLHWPHTAGPLCGKNWDFSVSPLQSKYRRKLPFIPFNRQRHANDCLWGKPVIPAQFAKSRLPNRADILGLSHLGSLNE
jgi:hypothetical protein